MEAPVRSMFTALLKFSLVCLAVMFQFAYADDKAATNPKVAMKTNMGTIVIELDQEKAPISVENFLSYVDDGYYKGTIFHRVIPDFMIQGGGMDVDLKQQKTKDPIKNEAKNGLKNVRGSLAMARTNDVDSATSQFFINLKDNNFLDHGARGFGYAVFGKVVEGMEVVDKIATIPTKRSGYHGNVPTTPVIIESVTKL